jgi:hypothetical protein
MQITPQYRKYLIDTTQQAKTIPINLRFISISHLSVSPDMQNGNLLTVWLALTNWKLGMEHTKYKPIEFQKAICTRS